MFPAAAQHLAAILRAKGLVTTWEDETQTLRLTGPEREDEDADDVVMLMPYRRMHKRWIPDFEKITIWKNGEEYTPDDKDLPLDEIIALLLDPGKPGAPGMSPVHTSQTHASPKIAEKKNTVIRV